MKEREWELRGQKKDKGEIRIDISIQEERTNVDREADIFELFALERPGNMNLLIRAAQDRRVQVGDSEI